LQADRRNDPVARFNDDPRYGYDRRLDAPPGGPATSAPAADPGRGYPADRDYRYDNPRYDTRAPQGSPLMPANNYGNYRDAAVADPGVAHFDGTITNPPPRTNP
jgi:hypothetical protein